MLTLRANFDNSTHEIRVSAVICIPGEGKELAKSITYTPQADGGTPPMMFVAFATPMQELLEICDGEVRICDGDSSQDKRFSNSV